MSDQKVLDSLGWLLTPAERKAEGPALGVHWTGEMAGTLGGQCNSKLPGWTRTYEIFADFLRATRNLPQGVTFTMSSLRWTSLKFLPFEQALKLLTALPGSSKTISSTAPKAITAVGLKHSADFASKLYHHISRIPKHPPSVSRKAEK